MKSPKSPERCPSTFPFPANSKNNNNVNGILLTPVKPQRGSVPNLISPPPEFSNTKIEITERYANGSAAFPTNSSTPIQHHSHGSKELLHRSHSYTPTPHHHHTLPSNVSYEEIRIPSRSSVSRDIIQQQRSTYSSGVSSHQSATTPRPSSSQSHYHDHRITQQPQRSLSRASNYTPNQGSYPPSSHQVRPIESYHYSSTVTSDNGNASGVGSVPYQDGRESVRSPLTLSMDSGISSSGVTNRKLKETFFLIFSALLRLFLLF